MLLHLLLGCWIALSAALVGAGAVLRFGGRFLVIDQFLLGVLFFFAALMTTVALIGSLPMLRRLPLEIPAGRFVAASVLAPASAMGLLLALPFETAESAEARHRAHLLRAGRAVAEAADAIGAMPGSLVSALDRSGAPAFLRDDADGQALIYHRIDDRTALLCAPFRRVHVVVRGERVEYRPWPEGAADPGHSAVPGDGPADRPRGSTPGP